MENSIWYDYDRMTSRASLRLAFWGGILVGFGLAALYVAFIRHSLLEGPFSPQGAVVGFIALVGGILLHDGLHALREALYGR